LESKIWQEQHTKKVLDEEKKKFVSEIGQLKTENASTDRIIKQAKTFTSKKDESHKKMKEKFDTLDKDIQELNKQTTDMTGNLRPWSASSRTKT